MAVEKSAFRFLDLPLDLKRHVLSFVDRPTDQKTLCLTCKEFQDLATPLLYRTMYLHVGGPQDLRLSAMLKASNPGLAHVRELYLRLEKMHVQERERYDHSDASSDEAEPPDDLKLTARQAHFTVRLLLDYLPRDTLETFRWQSWEPLSVDNFVRVCRTQRRLRVLQIDPTESALDPVLAADPEIFGGLTELDTVDVYPDSVDRLKAANRLLRARGAKVTQLSVSVAFELSNEVPEELHDSSTRPGVLCRTLFSHLLPFEKCEPLRLTGLELCDVSLRYCNDTWMKVIKFPSLERLEIQNCEGADVLFAQLSKEHHRPGRLHTLRWYDQSKCEHHAVPAMSNFLEALAGLEVIDIYLENMNAMPRVEGVLKHKATLQSLSVHSQSTESDLHYYADADVARICTECTSITQLSLVPPPPQNSENWNIELKPYPWPLFRSFLRHTYKLPRLAVLNLRRWPPQSTGFSGCYHQLAASLNLYEFHLQRLTQRIFVKADQAAADASGGRARLAIVAWGPNGRSRVVPGDGFRVKQVSFARGARVPPPGCGAPELLAVHVPWKMVQFIEAESDILDHSVNGLHDANLGI